MRAVEVKTHKMSIPKQQVCALSAALQSERKKSRATFAKLLDDAEAEGVMAEALAFNLNRHCFNSSKTWGCFE
jgi:hypothetical protein